MTPVTVDRLICFMAAAHAGVFQSDQVAAQREELSLSREAMVELLRTAKVIRSRRLGRGTTNPWRLTLSDGRVTHDAVFQSVDEHKIEQEMSDGRTELNFVDSYRDNIAAFRLAELLGLGEMMPVIVERTWSRAEGALSWWIDDAMEEGDGQRECLPSRRHSSEVV